MHASDLNLSPIYKANDTTQPASSAPPVHPSCYPSYSNTRLAFASPSSTDLQAPTALLDGVDILIDNKEDVDNPLLNALLVEKAESTGDIIDRGSDTRHIHNSVSFYEEKVNAF